MPHPHREASLSLLACHRVSPNQLRVYVQRADNVINTLKPTRIRDVSADQMTPCYLCYTRDQTAVYKDRS